MHHFKDERSRIKEKQKEVHRDYEGEHWNSYSTVLYSTLLGKGYNQAKLYRKIIPQGQGKI